MTSDNSIFKSIANPVYAKKGMVATSQTHAVKAGIEILKKGGNAADAAIATAAALNVTEPCSTGLGGDCFGLFYDSKTKNITALNGSGRAPKALSIDLVNNHGMTDEIPPYHPFTITIPGACAGWCDLIEKHGTMNMLEILAPAIKLAEEGFPVGPVTSHFWHKGALNQLKNSPGGKELTIDGKAPKQGEIFRNTTLANTLKAIAVNGKSIFYEGYIAEKISSTIKSLGGVMTVDDLASHTSTWDTPISTLYKNIRIHECPPNGQGLTALLALNILSCFDLPENPLSTERLHYVIESLRLAFADTRWYVTDPAFSNIPVNDLLSMEYAKERASLINPKKAKLDQKYGIPTSSSDTVYLSVVDGLGNACSFINSNYMGFGTGIVPEGLGFSLQNRGHNFSLNPDHPNVLAPNKRPYHTIIPAMATHDADDSLYSSFGVMGGFMQPQGHVQVVLGLLENDLDPQSALNNPRICIEDGSAGGTVGLEEGIPENVCKELNSMGHEVHMISGFERSLFGRGQIILSNPETGELCGGSDPRADGCALGY